MGSRRLLLRRGIVGGGSRAPAGAGTARRRAGAEGRGAGDDRGPGGGRVVRRARVPLRVARVGRRGGSAARAHVQGPIHFLWVYPPALTGRKRFWMLLLKKTETVKFFCLLLSARSGEELMVTVMTAALFLGPAGQLLALVTTCRGLRPCSFGIICERDGGQQF